MGFFTKDRDKLNTHFLEDKPSPKKQNYFPKKPCANIMSISFVL